MIHALSVLFESSHAKFYKFKDFTGPSFLFRSFLIKTSHICRA